MILGQPKYLDKKAELRRQFQKCRNYLDKVLELERILRHGCSKELENRIERDFLILIEQDEYTELCLWMRDFVKDHIKWRYSNVKLARTSEDTSTFV